MNLGFRDPGFQKIGNACHLLQFNLIFLNRLDPATWVMLESNTYESGVTLVKYKILKDN